MIPITIIKNDRVDPKAIDESVEFVRQNYPSPAEIRAQQRERIFEKLRSSGVTQQ